MEMIEKKRSLGETVLFGGAAGIAIGYLCTIITSYVFANGFYSPGVPAFINQFDKEIYAVTIQFVVYAIMGVIMSISSAIYRSNRGSLLGRSIVHFMVIIGTILVAGYFMKWFTDVSTLISIFVIALVIYMIIWTVSYFFAKKQLNKINQALEQKNM